jgi:hypothetical protein
MSTKHTEAETRRTDHTRWPNEGAKQKGTNEKGKGEGKKGGGGSHTRGRGQVTVAGVRQHETGMHPR